MRKHHDRTYCWSKNSGYTSLWLLKLSFPYFGLQLHLQTIEPSILAKLKYDYRAVGTKRLELSTKNNKKHDQIAMPPSGGGMREGVYCYCCRVPHTTKHLIKEAGLLARRSYLIWGGDVS